MSFDNNPRSGCKDIWNAFMAEGARFGPHDIPFCPTTAQAIPARQVTWEDCINIIFQGRNVIIMRMLLSIGISTTTSSMV